MSLGLCPPSPPPPFLDLILFWTWKNVTSALRELKNFVEVQTRRKRNWMKNNWKNDADEKIHSNINIVDLFIKVVMKHERLSSVSNKLGCTQVIKGILVFPVWYNTSRFGQTLIKPYWRAIPCKSCVHYLLAAWIIWLDIRIPVKPQHCSSKGSQSRSENEYTN